MKKVYLFPQVQAPTSCLTPLSVAGQARGRMIVIGMTIKDTTAPPFYDG